jgi:voltage-gated potassium channel
VSRVLISIFFVLTILVGGTLGYHFIEGWSLVDAFYMTAITVTTVGFGETHPLGPLGRVFTVLLMFTGMGTVFLCNHHAYPGCG